MRNKLPFINAFTTCNLYGFIKRIVAIYFLIAINFTVCSQTVSPLDEVAKWNFISSNIILNGAITVKDESGSGFTGTLMNDARIRTIGSTTKYNVLDLGNGTGYFDMGLAIGRQIYTLTDYTISAYYRVDATNTDLSSTGNCLWNFSNSANAPVDRNGYIFGSLRNQNHHITTGYFATGEQYVGAEVNPPFVASKNGWHHLAYTQSGTIGTIYIDGVKTSSGNVTNLPSIVLPKAGFVGTPFNWIGRSCYPGDAYLKKTLVYGFNLYRVALTADNMINYLNVPTVISNLNNAYAQDAGVVSNPAPDAAGLISGYTTVSQGQNLVNYSVPVIANATSYIWTLPTGATGKSTTNSISVNYSNSATSGYITVKGINQWGVGTASTLAIKVNELPVVVTSDTAKNCADTLILSSAIVYPVKISFSTLGYGPDNIKMAVYAEDSTKVICSFYKHVAANTDTTLYLSAGKYYLAWLEGGAFVESPGLSGDNVSKSGWIRMTNFLGLPFKVIENNIVCGGRVLLNAAAYYNGTGKLNYKWTPSAGLNNDAIANPTATVSSNTTYTVTAASPNGCTVTNSVNIVVSPLSADAGADKTVVCGGIIQLNSVTTNYSGTGKLRYKWTPSTGLNNDTIANPISNVMGDITYAVTVTSPSGCTATDDVKVNVTPLSVNAGADKTVVCGGTIQLGNVITNYTGTGRLRYKWIPSTGLSNDTIANPTASAMTNTTTYTVTVTSPSGCTATDDVKVNVTPLSANAGADKTVISGGTIQLNGITTNYTGTGKLRYTWSPSTGLSNDTIANPTATAITNITYTVTVTCPSGCIATDNVTVNITPMAKPEIGIVGVTDDNKNRVVWNKPVSIGIASYSIYRETNTSNAYEKIGSVPYDSLSVFIDNQSAADVKSNKYRLSIIDRNGMESAQSDEHKTMHLSINKGQNNTWNLIWEPYQGFNVSTYNIYRGTNPNNLNYIDGTSGSSTQFSDKSAPSGDVYYQLEVISPTLVSPSKAPVTIQKLKDSENSSQTTLAPYSSSRSNIATNVVAGINELEGQGDDIHIYPNPVRDELIINFEGGSTFDIINLMGQVIYTGNLNNSAIVQTKGLLAEGVYVIRFKTGKTFAYRKIIKE